MWKLQRLLVLVLAFGPFALRAHAQAPCQAQNDTPTFLDSVFTGNAWFAIRFDAAGDFSIDRVELFTGEISAVHELDLWSHDLGTGKPAALLGSGAFSIAPTNAWQGADLAASVALQDGETYWVVWRASLGAQASLDLPGATNGPWWTISVDGGSTWFAPVQSLDRQWKFRLIGDCSPGPSNYCTAGTTSNGCAALLSASGVASASASSGFTVTANSVEGQRQGLIFYSLSGALAQPWGTSSSFLCVKPPTQRTLVQGSGGTAGACDGALALDWNAFRAAHPSALGSPFAGGETVWLQAWFRDPPSSKTTQLSDALSVQVAP